MARTKLSGPRDKPKAKKKASVRLTPKAKKSVAKDGDKVPGAEPRRKAKRIDKTAAEMSGPRGSGIWDQLTKPFSLVLCHRTIAAAVMRNEQVSARAGLQEERKHVKELLKEKQSGAEYDKLAGRLLHIEDDIRRTKTTEKAAVESLLKLVLESVGGDLFIEKPDDDDGEEKAEKDLPGQLKLGEPDLSPEAAKPKVGERYVFTPKPDVARLSGKGETVGAVTHVTAMGHVGIQPDEGGGGIFELQRGLHDYTWEPAKDAA